MKNEITGFLLLKLCLNRYVLAINRRYTSHVFNRE